MGKIEKNKEEEIEGMEIMKKKYGKWREKELIESGKENIRRYIKIRDRGYWGK